MANDPVDEAGMESFPASDAPAWPTRREKIDKGGQSTRASVGPYHLPPLPFGYGDLEPYIDEATMKLHHDKHHQAYVDGVNKALSLHPEWLGMPIEEILRRLPELPDDIRMTVRNQGGGHANHQFFWKVLTPDSPLRPSGELAQAIDRDFGSFELFKAEFESAGMKHFGSGWVFLVADPLSDFRLEVLTLPNQESVLGLGKLGVLICDLWEHAYYLQYNNRRAEWLSRWWNVVNWDYAGERLQRFRAGQGIA